MPKFELGKIVATPAVMEAIPESALLTALERHAAGDWGLCCEEDAAENNLSVEQGFRILSVYEHAGTRYWVLTEADRSATTFLLPEEY